MDGGGAPPGIDEIATVEERASFLKQMLGATGMDPSFAAAADADEGEEAEASDRRGARNEETSKEATSSAAPAAVAPSASAPSASAPVASKEADPAETAAAAIVQAVTDEQQEAAKPDGPTRAERFEMLRARERARLEQDMHRKRAEQQLAEIERLKAAYEQDQKAVEPLLRIMKTKDLMALNEFVQEHFAPEDVAAAVPMWVSDEAREKWRMRSLKKEAEDATAQQIADLRRLVEEAVIVPKKREQEQEQQRAVYDSFANFVKQSAQYAPTTAELLNKNPQWLFALADSTAILLHKQNGHTTWPEIVQHIENNLPKASTPNQQTAQSSAGQSAPPNAAAKATTVTNGHAADRTTVVDAESPDDDSVDAIAARLRRQWQGAALQNKR